MSETLGYGSVVLDGTGAGTVRLPPVQPFYRWIVERISLTITGGVTNSGGEARMFRNDDTPGQFVDGTNTPWNDVFAAPLDLLAAENLIVVFTGCTSGETATVIIDGTRERL
jgi:pSer/pThr/pTyr-binding forkhead associated (FHA) protein